MTRHPSLSVLCKVLLFFVAFATSATGALAESEKGQLVLDQVYSPSLEGNLLDDSPERSVYIYLPHSYRDDCKARYPVVYLLHGFTSDYARWIRDDRHIGESLNRQIQPGKAREMIVVMPDAYNSYRGSFYTNSVVTGAWEEFVTEDLVNYVDSTYCTLADRKNRGIAGHSMGGYGAIKIAMKNPDLYSGVYAMSACCLAWPRDANLDWWTALLALKEPSDFADASFFPKAFLAQAAAYSPNPKRPPLFVDYPFKVEGGHLEPVADVYAKWAANSPLAMLDQYYPNLKQLAVAIDIGDQDNLLPSNRLFSTELATHGIKHSFEVYEGDHVNRVGERLEKELIPFFSAVFDGDEAGR